MKQVRRLSVILVSFSILIYALFYVFGMASAAPEATWSQRDLENAWDLATRLGEFNYYTRIEQTVQPLPTLANAGLGSSTEFLYIEGRNNLGKDEMSMRLWVDGQSPLNEENALEISVTNGRTLGRLGGGEWEEIDDISQLFAPGRDNLGFLAAAKSIRASGKETRSGISFSRYSFEIDGPAFALYMKQQMEDELAGKSLLPPGVRMEINDQYHRMSGQGELWVDGQGLPLRLVTDMTLPATESEQTSVHITTDFSEWDQSLAAKASTWQGRLAMESASMIRQGTVGLGTVAGGLGLFFAAFAFFRRIGWRRSYTTIMILIISIMVLVPLLQPISVEAAFDRLNKFQAQQDSRAYQGGAQGQSNATNNNSAGDFNPLLNPLAAANTAGQTDNLAATFSMNVQSQTTLEEDTDGDQLTDGTEALLCTDPNDPDTDDDGLSDGAELDPSTPLTDPCASDTDGDGLSDRVEMLELGTDPKDIDTDGDLISDKTEVQGFTGPGGQIHYLNALSSDTNQDSRLDGFECFALVDVQIGNDGQTSEFISGASPTTSTTCSDLDGDGEVDVLDRDDDGDGVPDKADGDPTTAITGGKKAANTCVNDYDCLLGISGNKFNLQLNSYNTNYPILTDFQIRPENPEHLQFMMHVLDWPDNDNRGQITTGIGNTFGASGSEANGDLRLFPMLEIKIPSENFTYPTLPKLSNAPAQISATTPITGWLDTSLFDDFSIVVRPSDAVSGDLLAYVPLNMIADPVSGDPVAFNGRMVYKPNSTAWGSNHTARLVWMVEVINPDKLSQFVHVYEDEWILTSLTVREDQGVEVAIAYEDPVFAQAQSGYDAATYTEQNLWKLADGLANSFALGRTDGNGNRDITVSEIARRWDKSTNASNGLNDGDDELWEIPKDALVVYTDTLAHQGELGIIPGKINQILTGTFTAIASQGVVTASVVTLAREEQVRLAGLKTTGVQTTSSGVVSLDGVQKEHYVATQMAAYKYDGTWQSFDANDYWVSYFRPRLQTDLDQAFLDLLGADANAETRLGFYAYAYATFVAQFAGLSNLVQRGLTVYESKLSVPDGVLAVGGKFTPTNVSSFVRVVVFFINIGASWFYTNDAITLGKAGSKDVRFVINKLKITSLDDLNDYIKRVDTGPVVDALDQYKRLNYWKQLVVDDKIAGNHLATVAGGVKSGKVSGFLEGLTWTRVKDEVVIGEKALPPAPPNAGYSRIGGTDDVTVDVFSSKLNKKATIALAIGTVIVLGAIVAFSAAASDDFVEFSTIAFSSAIAINESISIFQSGRQFLLAASGSGIQNATNLLDRAVKTTKLLKSQISQMTRITIAIGTVLEVVVAVGLFIGLAVSSGLNLASRLGLRASFELAGTLAVSVLMFALSLIPGIGVILDALISLIDAVLGIICAAGDDVNPRSFVCQGISGSLSILIGSVFYSFQTVVDPANANLVTTGDPSFTLVDESKGFTVGNQFNISLPVTATLYKNKINSLGTLFRPGFFSDENAMNSTFDFAIINSDIDRPVTSGANKYAWQALDKNSKLSEPDFKGGTTSVGIATLSKAGANTLVEDAYFSMSYAIPGLDCITVGCKEFTEQQTYNVKLADFAFDVLPANLDLFLNMTSVGSNGGYSFAWGQNEGLPFPILRDADGDGLASKAKGGLDPNDNQADSDGDRLGDFYEIQFNLDSGSADTDSDGLSDYDELYYGTDPTLADSDNDGLQDGDEVLGWTAGYGNGLITQVWSDPRNADVDQDGYIDSVEKAYGFNPNIADRGDILLVDTRFEEWTDVPAIAPCATLTINSLNVQDAVRDNDEPLEFADAEIAVLLDNRRVWFSEGLHDNQTVNVNVSFPFCDGQALIELFEIDQGAWSDDPIGDPIVLDPDDPSATMVLESSLQGSKVALTYSMGDYSNDTVPFLVPSDGFVAPGQDINIVSTVENGLQVRNALGLFTLRTPANWSSSNIVGQPFILPPNQAETFRGNTSVPNNINASGSYEVASSAGAFFDPNLHPTNSIPREYTPTVHITFDDANSNNGTYYNVAPGSTAVVGNVAGRNPSRDASGVFNEAVNFTRIGYDSFNRFTPQRGDALHVTDSSNSLALNGGSFTLASWIKRTEEISSTGAIAGYMPALDRKAAYPTLYVDGPDIGLYFGNGTTVCEVLTSNHPLVLNQWQHVAATFDATSGQAKIFLDGNRILTGNCSERPTQQSQFWIGRATTSDRIRYDRIYFEQNGIIGKGAFRLNSSGGGVVWSNESVGDNETYNINQTVVVPTPENSNWFYTVQRYNKTNGNIKATLIDGDINNSYVQGDFSDDPATIAELKTGSYALGWESGYYSRCDVNGCGRIDISHFNDSMHFFQAGLDDLRLYKEAVSEEGVRDIYLSADNTLELRLDEAPGAYIQYDYSGKRYDGYCEGSACPVAGVPGRSSRAIEFDGSKDLVTLEKVSLLGLNRDKWTIAGWVNPSAADGIILATGGLNPVLQVDVSSSRPRIEFGIYGFKANNPIPLGQWTHLAFVRDGTDFTIFVNGVSQGTLATSAGLLTDGPVYLGGNPAYRNTVYAFEGLLDQLTIRPAALDQPAIQDLINSAPRVYVPFDEPTGSSSFRDVARRTSYACSTAASCPTADQDGQQYGSIRFDGNDYLQLAGAQPPINSDWTMAIWVKVDELKSGNQGLMHDYNSRDLIDMYIDPAGFIYYGVCSNNSFSSSASKIIPGTWNHVAVSYNDALSRAELYLNGSLDNSKSVTGCSSSSSTALEIGFGGVGFEGEIDELTLYGTSLKAEDISDLFAYQVAWFDSRDTGSLFVDVDAPMAALATTAPLVATNPTIAITASDQQQTGVKNSGVFLVEYQVDGGGWQEASRDGEVWLFALDTSNKGGGSYTIQLRATDFVGNQSAISQGIVEIDATGPSVSLTGADPRRDTIQLDGIAGDTNGISDVRVEILDHDGTSLAGPFPAALSGNGSNISWSAVYTTPLPLSLYGYYDVQLLAIDGPGNVVTATTSIAIDQTQPTGFLTDIGTSEGVLAGTGNNLPVISGYASDLPYLPNESLNLQFEEATAPFFDSSPNRNHATCSNCPSVVAGQFGQAASFDGVDDRLTIANANGLFDSGLDIEGQISFAAWIKPASLAGEQLILGRGADANNQVFLRLKDGQYQTGVIDGGTSYIATYSIPSDDLNQWVHLAGVYNGGEWLLYRNGEIVSRSDAALGGIISGDNWTVGGSAFGGNHFDGLIDGLFLYPRQVPLNNIAAMAEPVGAPILVVSVGLLPLQYLDTPTQTVSFAATLDQPNSPFTTWSLQLPAGIEGPHRLSLVVIDINGTLTYKESIWSGEIDTLAPSATLSYWDEKPGRGAFYACDVSDYNLTLSSINCPIPGNQALSVLEYQDAEWFVDIFSPTLKLKRAATDGGYWLVTKKTTPELTACDLYGNCSIVTATPGGPPAAPVSVAGDGNQAVNRLVTATSAGPEAASNFTLNAATTATTTVRIEQPTAGSGFTDLSAGIPISGFITAQNFPVTLTVQVDGNDIASQTWTSSTTQLEEWSTTWTPAAAGTYTLSATLTDSLGLVTSDTDTPLGFSMPALQIHVSNQPPAASIDSGSTVIGSADLLPDGTVNLGGQASDALGVQLVEARFDNAPWQLMQIDSSSWHGGLPYPATAVASGDTFTLEVRATNLVNLTTTISDTVTIDLVAPDPFTATLNYDTGSNYVPLGINETVSAVSNPTLRADWTSSSDSSGISDYEVSWFNIEADGTLTVLFTETVTGTSSSLTGVEGQRIVVEVSVKDFPGNEQTATAGPIYLDDSLTPAYVDMTEFGLGNQPYRNWTADSCNALGDDRRRLDLVGDLSSIGPQNFYATWNAIGLRLAWRGANWNVNGDLFIYLDTGSGGAGRLYNPYLATANDTIILLPPGMAADFAIWVQDADTASLLSWDGSAWIDSGQVFTFVHENDLPQPQSDLFVPFSSLGNPSTLSLVAVASEEDALRLWASLPSANSVNSESVVPGADSQPAHLFSLTQAYSFADLGSGVCPSSGNDYSALSASARSDVDVIAYSQLSDGLFFVMPDTLSNLHDWSSAVNDLCTTIGDAPLCDRALVGHPIPAPLDFDPRQALAGQVSLDHQAIGPNETINIVVDIANQGSAPLNGLEAFVTVGGPIQLLGSTTISVPTTAAGETASLTIQVQAIGSPADAWGSVDIVLYDGVSGSVNEPLEWVFVDVEVDNGAPTLVMLDPSLVVFNQASQQRLFGTYVDQSPIQSVTIDSYQTCINQSDIYGIWECSSVGPTSAGTAGLSARDVFGAQSSTATSPVVANVQDQTAPTLTVGLETEAIFVDSIVNAAESILKGTVSDDISSAAVEICYVIGGEEICEPASVQSANTKSVGNFSYGDQQPTGLAIPACSNPLIRSFTVNESFTIADLDIGLTLAHPFRNDVLVTLTTAQGTAVTIVAGGTGAANYSLLLDDTATASLSTDYSDHDHHLPFSSARRPANEVITALSSENAQGTWSLSICDQYPAADNGTYYESKLFFSTRDTVRAAGDKWTYHLSLPANRELPNQVLRIYAVDEAGNRSAPHEYTYTLDTLGPEVAFDTFFSGQVTDVSGVQFMTIKYHGPNGETVEDKVTLDGSTWSYPPGFSFEQDKLYAIYIEASDFAGNRSSISAYDYFAGNNPPQAADDNYVTDEDTFFFANASQGVLANDNDPDGDRLAAVHVAGPAKGVLILNGDGSVSYDPNGEFDYLKAGEYENVTFTYQASDSRVLSAPATVTIRVDGVNDPPEANIDAAVTDEDTPVSIAVLANDTDPEGQPLSIGYFDPEGLVISSTVDLITGTAGLITPSIGVEELTFDPNGDFETMTDGDSGYIWFTYQVLDPYGLSSTANVSVTINGVNDAPVFLNDPATLDVQYSDFVTPTTLTVHDVDADSLIFSQAGLPGNVTLVDQGCDSNVRPLTCTALITGTVQAPAGTYTAAISVTDGLITSTQIIAIEVAAEDTFITLDGNNPVAVGVTAPESNASEPFEIVVYVEELRPDLATYIGAPGDINLVEVSTTLEPVGPGNPVNGICTETLVDPVTGYDDVLTITCAFDGVAVNTYLIKILIDGGYYLGYNEDVVVVYDPSLGFTTGGGTFYWPGSEDLDNGYKGDKTNFGYTMKYNKPMTNIQGNLLLIRHMPDGTIYRLKSNAIEGLSIGDVGLFGWASFTGKGTYQESGWEFPIGNHSFLVYIEDHNEPGVGIDKVWVETRDRDGQVIPAMSMVFPGDGNAVEIASGNVVVPHSGGTGNQQPTADFSYAADGFDVAFTDLSRDPGGSVVAWEWDFGDGNVSDVPSPSHTYGASGTYDVLLTVTDDEGAQDTTAKQVTLSGGNGASEIHVSALTGSSTSVGDGSIWIASVTITVVDDAGNPVANATVSGSWSKGDLATSSCPTDASGTCTVVQTGISDKTRRVIFTVDDVSHASLAYNVVLNVVTSIRVDRP